jgi:hypothetical protein
MANIIIYPSNEISRQPGRIPKIDFSNTGTITLQVISGATIQFGTNTLYVAISNSAISGSTINVKDYFSVGGTQVINGTNNWIGPTSGIDRKSVV